MHLAIKVIWALKYYIGALLLIWAMLFLFWYLATKPPASFNEKVDQANVQMEKVELGTFLKKETLYVSMGGNPRNGTGTCGYGSYSTPGGGGWGRWCYKGYAKYFGLPEEVTEDRLDTFNRYMATLGWRLSDSSDEYAAQKVTILNSSNRGGGFSYVNSEGLKADLTFSRRGAMWDDCDTYTVCKLANDPRFSNNPTIVRVSIYYEIRPF